MQFLKKSSWLERLLVVAIFVMVVRSLLPMFSTGFPTTHDGEGQVARIANYAVALRQGQFPPRFAPTFWNGYGYPVFNFYYPLLSILGAPLVLVGIHPEIVLKLCVSSAWLLLWLGIGLYAYKLTQNKVAALVAVLLFLMSPYFYTVVYVRGAYGELLASAAFIWLLCLLEARAQNSLQTVSQNPEKLSKRTLLSNLQKLSVGVVLTGALVLLAHNIYASILFPFAGLYALARRQKTTVLSIMSEFSLAFGLAAFFWIPMLLEKKYIVLDDQVTDFFQDHFLQLPQLLNSTVTSGVSMAGSQDTISLGVGWAGVGVAAASLGYFALTRKQLFNWSSKKTAEQAKSDKNLDLNIKVSFGTSLLCIILLFSFSTVLWKTIFILPYFQFPWRFLGPLTLALAISGALLWATHKKLLQGIIGVGILLHILYIPSWYWPIYTHFAPDYFLNYFQTSTVYDETKAKTFTVEPGVLSPGTPEIRGAGTVETLKWRGTYRTYIVKATEVVTVVEPTMYFPGWKVWANGSEVELVTYETSPKLAQELKGQVAYTLPAGEWQIRSKMTQQTPARLVGNTITLASLGGMGWLIFCRIFDVQQKIRRRKSMVVPEFKKVKK